MRRSNVVEQLTYTLPVYTLMIPDSMTTWLSTVVHYMSAVQVLKTKYTLQSLKETMQPVTAEVFTGLHMQVKLLTPTSQETPQCMVEVFT